MAALCASIMSFRRSRRFLNDLRDNDDEAMTAAVGAALARETVLL